MRDRVLVTGCSGFIAKHIVLELLRRGYDVRGTVRGEARANEVRQVVERAGEDVGRCEFVGADLDAADGWDAAARGCRYVLHTASPFPLRQPRRADALIATARQGTDFVLRAAAHAQVERAIVTSSIAAVIYGHPRDRVRPFDERDYTNIAAPSVSAYARSKTVAELHAWDVSRETGLPISTINPGLVLGPLLDARMGTSGRIVALMLKGYAPVLPDIRVPAVDVRDVATAHVLALTAPEAGRRFLLVASETPSFPEIAALLDETFPERRSRIPRWSIPGALIRAAAYAVPSLGMLAEQTGRRKEIDSGPARELLGLSFKPIRAAAVALAESLLHNRCV